MTVKLQQSGNLNPRATDCSDPETQEIKSHKKSCATYLSTVGIIYLQYTVWHKYIMREITVEPLNNEQLGTS